LEFSSTGYALTLRPGQKITIADVGEFTITAIISAEKVTVNSEAAFAGSKSFTVQQIYPFVEAPGVSVSLVAENLYKVLISGAVEVLLYYPNEL
jgi:hypothetical protein